MAYFSYWWPLYQKVTDYYTEEKISLIVKHCLTSDRLFYIATELHKKKVR